MESTFRIAHLSEHPETLPVLKEWFETEWSSYYGPKGSGDAQGDLFNYSNRGHLPLGIIAFLDNKLCGIAVLKEESISSHSHLSPWVAAGLVHPSHRGKGIGTRMLKAAEDISRQLGYSSLYCGTNSANRLLEKNGWKFIEKSSQNDEEVSIYQRVL